MGGRAKLGAVAIARVLILSCAGTAASGGGFSYPEARAESMAPKSSVTGESRTGQTGAGSGSADNLQNFFRLNENLPRAVCDEAMVSRAPTLSAASEEKAPALAPGLGASADRYELVMEVSEPELISFLMEDSTTLMAGGVLQALWSEAGGGTADPNGAAARLREFRRRISLEVCTAVVTPDKVEQLLRHKPGLFLKARKLAATGQTRPSRRPKAGEIIFHLRDVEGRFGKVDGKWWLAGWIEPYEVLSAFAGGREYRRLANPVTNQVQYVQVLGRTEMPLGYLFPTSAEARSDWKTLKAQSESHSARTKQVETYRLLVEHEAYHALTRRPDQAESIRKLQEFYKSLMNAYQLYPEDERFAGYKKSGRAVVPPGMDGVKKALDESFFSAVGKARMNGARVALGFFDPDPKLHGIFEEYRERLRSSLSARTQ